MEEYAIRHITSIRVENSRKPVLGAILLLVGMAFMANGGAGILFGLLIGALGVLFLIGSPSVTLNTAGGEKVVSSGSPFQRGAGEAYAAAVRKALFPS